MIWEARQYAWQKFDQVVVCCTELFRLKHPGLLRHNNYVQKHLVKLNMIALAPLEGQLCLKAVE